VRASLRREPTMPHRCTSRNLRAATVCTERPIGQKVLRAHVLSFQSLPSRCHMHQVWRLDGAMPLPSVSCFIRASCDAVCEGPGGSHCLNKQVTVTLWPNITCFKSLLACMIVVASSAASCLSSACLFALVPCSTIQHRPSCDTLIRPKWSRLQPCPPWLLPVHMETDVGSAVPTCLGHGFRSVD